MNLVYFKEAREERSRDLKGLGLNGISQVFVTLEPGPRPAHAWLDVEFFNTNHLSPLPPVNAFSVSVEKAGGGGATQPAAVQVTQVAAGATRNNLRLQVAPIGGYSTYTLHIVPGDFDPFFADVPFKFRPGCFNLNCAPDWNKSDKPPDEPAIDYLAKDYDSFRHVLITAMMGRVPGWQPTSEADLDQVLIDLIAADADELSDYQDRVMNEAYLATARKRVSLARHARLMDYHIHQGNQASTWVALEVSSDVTLPGNFGIWTGEKWNDPEAVIFAVRRSQKCCTLLNALELHTWSDAVSALEFGSTEADLVTPHPMTEIQANMLRDLLLSADVERLLIQEELNPETGTVNGRDIGARQILRLVPHDAAPPRAECVHDPVAGTWLVRVRWLREDRLRRRYCLFTRCTGQQPITGGVTRFYGNLVEVAHGRPWKTTFRAPREPLDGADESNLEGADQAHYDVTEWGVLCSLTRAPLAYGNTDPVPCGEVAPRSTLEVKVTGFADPYAERTDLIDSKGNGRHFIVETDEAQRSFVRFGDGITGAALPDKAEITCRYQVGQGTVGNVGADKLTGFAPLSGVISVRNPLDVTNGRDPEPAMEILRRVPEVYRQRQLRAVTLSDYKRRAEEVTGVAHAHARYAWTGSWRTVRVAIDPQGSTGFDPVLRRRVADALEAVRLIGEDLEIRAAVYVPLDIRLKVCAHPHYWPEHLRISLEMEYSDGYTPDGRPGFFHSDRWTFGQALHASQIVGRALLVQGVEHVLSLSMRRWNPGRGGGLTTVTLAPDALHESLTEKLAVEPHEIVQVVNDPNHLEYGRIAFEIVGGRR